MCAEDQKLWLWQNGDHFLAFDKKYPCYDGGDPMTLGEPYGEATFHHSFNRGGDIPWRIRNVLGKDTTPEIKLSLIDSILREQRD